MRANYQTVLDTLQRFPGEFTYTLPNGPEIGWNNEKLCIVLKVMKVVEDSSTELGTRMEDTEDERWVEWDCPFNTFVTMCKEIPEKDITSMIFSSIIKQENKKGSRT